MTGEQQMLRRLLDRVPVTEVVRILFAKTASESKAIWMVVLSQVYFTFNQGFFLLFVIAVLFAISVSMQAGYGLSVIGATERLGELWTWIVFRTFAPLLSAMLIIARSCTAVAAETAVMKYNKEIEALEMMGIPAVEFVFTPRIIAGAISSFCMSFAFVIIAFFFTWLSKNWFSSISLGFFYQQVSRALTLEDIVFFVAKTAIVGAGIFWIACRKGLSLYRASYEIPVSAMGAVVDGFIWIFITHGFFMTLFIMKYGFRL